MKNHLLTTALLALALTFLSCSGSKDKPPQVVAVTGVTLNKSAVTLAVNTDNTKETLVATVQPSDATNKSVAWSTSNADVVSVDNGIVTAIASGTATITATAQGGEKAATCNVTVEGPDVWVGINGAVGVRGLYKNGFLQSQYKVSIRAVFVSGDDVYAVTGSSDGTGYFKNAVSYPHGGCAKAIAVSGNDVYTGGFVVVASEPYVTAAKLWKNGVEQPLDSFDGGAPYDINSIAVSNGDVYATGTAYSKDQNGKGYGGAVMWKNGKIALGIPDAELSSVSAANGNIYVVGYVCEPLPAAKLWINGVEQQLQLPAGIFSSHARRVFVSSSDVYVLGYYSPTKDSSIDFLLKNNVRQDFPANFLANEIFVHGQDVYILGVEGSGSQYLWKNGVKIQTQSSVNFIYVK